MIKIYTQQQRGEAWLKQYRGRPVVFACGLGFTKTALIPNISAAGATPESRKYTAIADAECVHRGFHKSVTYPLPPLTVGASPAILSRAIVETYDIPTYLFNTGLAITPNSKAVPLIDVGGKAAQCVSTGQALPIEIVKNLFEEGLAWGEKLAEKYPGRSLVLGECVVAGTTTALAVLTALGYDAKGKVNSSHLKCNHDLKWDIVQQGLGTTGLPSNPDPLEIIAAVGDPMQIFIAGMAIAASHHTGVLLAGGTQMLAVYALMKATANFHTQTFQAKNIIIGTTRWVAEDPTGDTIGLAETIGDVPLLATQLNFQLSKYPQLQAYEQGYVKEGVGAGGLSCAATFGYQAEQDTLQNIIEKTLSSYVAYNP